MRRIPLEIIHHPDAKIAVVRRKLKGAHGEFDAHNLTISINPGQSIPEEWVVLVHELLHLIESNLLESGVIKRRIDHRFITHAAPVLFGVLGMSGMLTGVTSAEAKRLVRDWIKQYGESP